MQTKLGSHVQSSSECDCIPKEIFGLFDDRAVAHDHPRLRVMVAQPATALERLSRKSRPDAPGYPNRSGMHSVPGPDGPNAARTTGAAVHRTFRRRPRSFLPWTAWRLCIAF
ncbi:MAG: hypothetical protein NVS3B21_32550 [Acidimicrobiales bacterium]